jgi:hypothetical protein
MPLVGRGAGEKDRSEVRRQRSEFRIQHCNQVKPFVIEAKEPAYAEASAQQARTWTVSKRSSKMV